MRDESDRIARRVLCSLAATISVAGCDGAGSECNAAAIQRALDEAGAGETVVLGECTIEGSLIVRAGVTLAGRGSERTTIDATGPYGVWLEQSAGGADATQLTGVTVRDASRVGVLARGAGPISVSDVRIESERGIGVGADGGAELTLFDMVVVGPVTIENQECDVFLEVAPAVPVPLEPLPMEACGGAAPRCTTGETRTGGGEGCPMLEQFCDPCGRWRSVTATHGLWLAGAGPTTLTRVEVNGFALFGAVALDMTSVSWNGGAIRNTLGVGLFAEDASLDLDGISIANTLTGFRGSFSYAAYLRQAGASSMRIDTNGLSLTGNASYGVVHVGTSALHTDLEASNNGDATLWVGGSDDFQVTGESVITGSSFAGAVLTGSSGVMIAGLRVEGTRLGVSRIQAGGGLFTDVELGDGIQLVDTTGVVLEDCVLVGNERLGLLVGLAADGTVPAGFRNVSVTRGAGMAGAVAGMPVGDHQLMPGAPAGWDTGIERTDVTAAEDNGLSTLLDAVRAIAPDDLPRPDDIVGAIAPCD